MGSLKVRLFFAVLLNVSLLVCAKGVDFSESRDLQHLQDEYDDIKNKFNENDSDDPDDDDDDNEDAKREDSQNDNALMREEDSTYNDEDALLDEEDNTNTDEDSRDLENDQQEEKKYRNEVEIREDNPYEDYDASCSKGMCQMGIQPIGCFYDPVAHNRPLPILLDTHRDPSSHAFHGDVFKWKDAEGSIRKLACHCAKIARQRGMTHFGLQYFGECWGSKTGAKDYASQGPSKSCVNGKYQPCRRGEFCIGMAFANYVYAVDALTHVPCSLKYEKVGCFYDPVLIKPRPLPELLTTHRDRTSHVYHGVLIDWRNYRQSLEELICICAEKAKNKGYSHFGIQYYAECWSGNSSATTYNQNGTATHCDNADFETCDTKSSCPCTGTGFSNFVYKLN